MRRDRLSSEAAALITTAQNMLAGLKGRFPDLKGREMLNRNLRFSLEQLNEPQVAGIQHVMYVLGERVPHLARAEKIHYARELLYGVRGMLIGLGEFSENEAYALGAKKAR